MTGNKAVGSGADLADDHPVSIEYTAASALLDGELVDPTSAAVVPLVFADKVECASCHDVHNTVVIPKLLTVANDGSALCLTCHVK